MTHQEIEPRNEDLLVPRTAEQGVFYEIVRAANRLEGELNRLFRPHDLTTATFAILTILERAKDEGLSCGDISTQLIAAVPDMTRLLDRLEKLEYITRERSALDRRMVKVKPTQKGLEAVSELQGQVEDVHRRQFSGIAPERLSALRSLLVEVGREGKGVRVSQEAERAHELKRSAG